MENSHAIAPRFQSGLDAAQSFKAGAQWCDKMTSIVLTHGERVGRLAFAIARQMTLPVARARELAAAACLHDLGKLLVPLEILEHPGALDNSMRRIINDHPTLGADLIAIVDRESDVASIVVRRVVLCHHERWDGQGYPYGLVGADIPIEARIVAVADTYDALICERSYKRAWHPDAALDYVNESAGGQFDPTVVSEFTALVQSTHPRFWCNETPGDWEESARRKFGLALSYVFHQQIAPHGTRGAAPRG